MVAPQYIEATHKAKGLTLAHIGHSHTRIFRPDKVSPNGTPGISMTPTGVDGGTLPTTHGVRTKVSNGVGIIQAIGKHHLVLTKVAREVGVPLHLHLHLLEEKARASQQLLLKLMDRSRIVHLQQQRAGHPRDC